MWSLINGHKHLIKSQQFDRSAIEEVFGLADYIEKYEKQKGKGSYRPLINKEMVLIFVQESLRTRASFQFAHIRLGGVFPFTSEAAKKFSSMAKGESLEDTIIVLNEYEPDEIILRHDEEGGAERAALVSEVPIVNAGDGPGQHPTQALLDLYTIKKHLGRIDELEIILMGDVLGSRTINSIAFLFGRCKGITIYFVSPPHLRVRSDIKEYLERHNVKFEEGVDVRDFASRADVFYQTRTQTNLGTQPWDRKDQKNGYTVIDGNVLSMAKPDSIILHPLPCLDEIVRSEVDSDPRAVYIKTKNGRTSQVKCGLYIRMAIDQMVCL